MKKNLILGALAVVILAGGFYGGTIYAKSKKVGGNNFAGGNFDPANMRGGAEGMAKRQGLGAGNFNGGEIIAVDDKSVTVKAVDGNSKIIFYSTSTEISKMVSAISTDLIIGENIMVTGQANSDGSLTAKNIQIRPKGILLVK